MATPLFNLLGGGMNMLPPQLRDISNLVQRLNEFRQGVNADPKQQVQELLNSGKMTQSQYNQLAQMATMIQKMINH